MRHSGVGSAAHPPWVVPKEMGGGGGNRGGGRKPDKGHAQRGGDRRSRRETAVDENRKETVDRTRPTRM